MADQSVFTENFKAAPCGRTSELTTIDFEPTTERRIDAVSRIFDIAARLMFEPGGLVAIEAWNLPGQSRAWPCAVDCDRRRFKRLHPMLA